MQKDNRIQGIDIVTANGVVFNIHAGAKYGRMWGTLPVSCMEFMEVMEEPTVKKNEYDESLVSWVAKNLKTGNTATFCVNMVEMYYHAPRIYAMDSDTVRRSLKITRARRKKKKKVRKWQGYVRTWQVLILEKRPNQVQVLVNVKTGKQRVLVKNGNLLIEDKDIDFDDLLINAQEHLYVERRKALEGKRTDRNIQLVEHDADGYALLKWVYSIEVPGFGTNGHLNFSDIHKNAYCLVNANLEIVIPFGRNHDFKGMKELFLRRFFVDK